LLGQFEGASLFESPDRLRGQSVDRTCSFPRFPFQLGPVKLLNKLKMMEESSEPPREDGSSNDSVAALRRESMSILTLLPGSFVADGSEDISNEV
jgi:hypothetical protein